MANVAKDLAQLISQSKSTKTGPYDTQATVKRVEGNKVWVSIPGGVDETPIDKTVNCTAGDKVQVRVSGGRAWITGNASAPPTDDTTAIKARTTATEAQVLAVDAKETADAVEGIAQAAQQSANTAATAAAQAVLDAAAASSAATAAQSSADNASEYAARALGNLSTVQSVAETLTWITAHGTMTLTADVTPDPTHVYFVVDAGGDYTVGGVTYAIVTEPVTADMGTYYELSIDESLNNYVGTHLALDSEGLWLLPASTGTNKVLIATGAGSTYTTAGTYLVDSGGSTVASFRANGVTIGQDVNGQSRNEISSNGLQVIQNVSGTSEVTGEIAWGSSVGYDGSVSDGPYYTMGFRLPGSTAGTVSMCEGSRNTASHFSSHAEGFETIADGRGSHAEGYGSKAYGDYSHAEGTATETTRDNAHAEGNNAKAIGVGSHAEGTYTDVTGDYGHAQNFHTKASSDYQTALGKYNVEDNADTYAVIIGNGTADNARSNALTVEWTGDVTAAGDIEDGSGNVLSKKLDATGILDLFYPVGSYYETSDTTFNPNTSWGGTWQLETEGQVHISGSTNGTYQVTGAPTDTNDGGSADAIIPYHKHSVSITSGSESAHTHGKGSYAGSSHSHGINSGNGYFVYSDIDGAFNAGFTGVSGASRRVDAPASTSNIFHHTKNTAGNTVTITGTSAAGSSHSHSVSGDTGTVGRNQDGTTPTGNNYQNANMQPYIIVNRWHRTA